jgi:hypothetical protein
MMDDYGNSLWIVYAADLRIMVQADGCMCACGFGLTAAIRAGAWTMEV